MKRLDPQVDAFIQAKVEHVDESIMHKMLGEEHQRNLLVLSDALVNLFEDATDDEVKELFGVLGRNQQGVGTCALTTWLNSGDDEERDAMYDAIDESVGIEFMNNEGVGLYKEQSMANHSCRPNAEVQFRQGSHQLSLVMTESVEMGDEITIRFVRRLFHSSLNDQKLSGRLHPDTEQVEPPRLFGGELSIFMSMRAVRRGEQ